MLSSDIKSIPYTAASLSIFARFIFMYLLYKNRSTNNLSLLFCGINICSSGLWIYYSVYTGDTPMIMRSTSEITMLTISAIYIIRNKVSQLETNRVLPLYNDANRCRTEVQNT